MTRVARRVLIVNADDFGLSDGINRGVIRAHERGIVTSASLMVHAPASEQAAAYCRDGGIGAGLHVDLGEWVYDDGAWKVVYEVVPLDDGLAVEAEVGRQLASFERLVGREPTHLDSHQHVHRSGAAAEATRRVAAELGVPLRSASAEITHIGDFYGQTDTGAPLPEAITPDRLVELIRSLAPGVSELSCHPGEGRDFDSPYRDERERELTALCHPRVRNAVESEGILLAPFASRGTRRS